MTEGQLITFEGGEGSGKTTQIEKVADFLQQWGYSVLVTREPGGSSRCQDIRNLILKHHDNENLSAMAELLLYIADRAQHVDAVIRPALAKGYVVLCDRYTDSTLTYQGYGRGLDLRLIDNLNQMATCQLVPALTFWLDLPPEIGLARVNKRAPADRLEAETLAFHQRIWQGYQDLAQQAPERFVKIDASLSPDQVFDQIKDYLQRK